MANTDDAPGLVQNLTTPDRMNESSPHSDLVCIPELIQI